MSEHRRKPVLAQAVKALLPLIFITAGSGAWAYFKNTAPVIERVAPQRQITTVAVQPAEQTEAGTIISAMGTVVPSREVILRARVSGTVLAVASEFAPGGRVMAGTEILSIDPSDHEVAVQKAKSALADAEAALAIEQGNQNIAREELNLLAATSPDGITDTDLALRKPQLQQAKAAVSSAQADLRQAILELDRTMVHSPFNAMIIARSVNTGTYVGTGDTLATIVGTDEFWVEALVPLDQLTLIDLSHDGGCPAVVRSQSGDGRWDGRVVRVAGKLNETSRMATVIVAVDDPLGQTTGRLVPHLMIDDYVTVEISGRMLPDIIELPRAALQDDSAVWICNDNRLDIRPVTLAWKNADKVYVRSGLNQGELVITSDLSAPVQGMPLKIANTPKDANHTEQNES